MHASSCWKGSRPSQGRLIVRHISRFSLVSGLLVVPAFVVLVAWGTMVLAAQDKYTLQLPNGLPFSEFRGYEDWQVVSVSQTDELLKAMVANPVMIAAY